MSGVATTKGTISIVHDLTGVNTSDSTRALSVGKGKDLDTKISTIQGLFPKIEWSLAKVSPSASTPYLRADQDQASLSVANWPDLVPWLRGAALEVGAATVFDVAGFTTGTVTRLQLVNSLTARNLIRALLEDVRFQADVDSSNNPVTVDDTIFSAWGMIVTVTQDIGTGTNAPKAGQEYRIRFNSSLANTLDPTSGNCFISVNKDTSSLATTGTGKISIFPYRIVGSTTTARWLKWNDATIRSAGSTYFSGAEQIEVPVGMRVRDQLQGHFHGFFYSGSSVTTGGPAGFDNINLSSGSGPLTDRVRAAIADGTNGTPRNGPKTSDRSGVGYPYLYGKTYTP